MTILRRLLLALAGLFGVLAVTGIDLNLERQLPTTWAGTGAGDALSVVHDIHRVAAFAFVATAVVTAIAAVTIARGAPGPLGRLGVGVGLLACALLATGYLVEWDQLRLWAVTVGTDMMGFTPVFGDDVRYVQLGSTRLDLDRGSQSWWFVLHAGVLPVVAVGGGIALARATRRRDRPVASPAA